MPIVGKPNPGSELLSPKDHALALMDFSSQMAVATKSVAVGQPRNDSYGSVGRRWLLSRKSGVVLLRGCDIRAAPRGRTRNLRARELTADCRKRRSATPVTGDDCVCSAVRPT